MLKLYRTYSDVEDFKGKDVRFLWLCEKRSAPVLPYDDLIKNLGTLDAYITNPSQGAAHLRKAAVDELLTEDEVEQLRDYLKQRHGLALDIEEVPLPMDRDAGGPFGNMPADGETAYYRLSEELGYNLSIPIKGYACLKTSRPAVKLGVAFVEEVLKSMKVSPPPNLKEIVVSVISETGLFVDRESKKQKKMDL